MWFRISLKTPSKPLVNPLRYAAVSSCFSKPAPLPKYTGPLPPNQTDNEIPETYGDEEEVITCENCGKPNPPVSVCVCVCNRI